MNNINVEIILEDGAIMPEYQTTDSAGFDISCIEQVELMPQETKLVRTGLKMAIPRGYELQLRPRSGLSLKTELIIKNSPATIDADYRGEIKVILKNSSFDKVIKFNKGERICQGVFNQVPQAIFNSVSDLNKTNRGDGGFGSTGK